MLRESKTGAMKKKGRGRKGQEKADKTGHKNIVVKSRHSNNTVLRFSDEGSKLCELRRR